MAGQGEAKKNTTQRKSRAGKGSSPTGAAAAFASLPAEAFFASGPGAPLQHVYMYGRVSQDSLRKLRADIDAACRGGVDDAGNEVAPRPIVLHINSPGGNAMAGISMMSVFSETRVPICACVDGISASAATFLSVLAPYRVMAAGATCLVHDYASFMLGKREDLLFEVSVVGEALTDTIKRMYLRRSRLTPSQLDELMQRDLLLDAGRCLRSGLCDRVLEAQPSAAARKAPSLPLAVALRKTNLNHVRFECGDVDDYALGVAQRLDALLGAQMLKPVVLHADGMACLGSVTDHVVPTAQRVACLSSLTETYGVIDTHVDLVNVLPLLHCRQRVMYSHAAVRVHMVYEQGFGWMLRDAVANTDLMLDLVRTMLRARTHAPAELVDGLDRRRFLLSAADCLRYGLVDTVIDGA